MYNSWARYLSHLQNGKRAIGPPNVRNESTALSPERNKNQFDLFTTVRQTIYFSNTNTRGIVLSPSPVVPAIQRDSITASKIPLPKILQSVVISNVKKIDSSNSLPFSPSLVSNDSPTFIKSRGNSKERDAMEANFKLQKYTTLLMNHCRRGNTAEAEETLQEMIRDGIGISRKLYDELVSLD
eukprot:TRINITY_DN6907_c0_g1_i2.p1 TRINITY_DN6907_c0_g1~~TRINITY_DN6907_c0_g1_i2.p1  ORF type:complete len:183 (+),score=31.19 TRINITY_DN6907_c0_g1_i2:688-1236(+)